MALLDAGDLVGPEIVGHDDVAGLQGRHQDLCDVGAEALAIDRAVEDPRCGQPRDPHRGEKRAGLPAPAGGVVVDARAARSSRRGPYALSPADDRLCHPTPGGWTDETGHHPMP